MPSRIRLRFFQYQRCSALQPSVGVRNERLPWVGREFKEANHNVVPAFESGDDVRKIPPRRNSVGVRKIGNPAPKAAVTGNLGLEIGTPLV